ncbi:MAG: lipoprotein insertase outer membrane protein LolB [Methyloprofundus sp.]|nr:lipoprotein insertase outer membrane protein LolB [Methyloprofundus sp.]MDT8426367.1 lipoprotein insertase outer membrane protein LolB [Methyloprofundus sp.]
MVKVLVGLLLFGLTACSSIDTYQASSDLLKTRVSINLPVWVMDGRLLITGQDVITANINWQHAPAIDKLKLAGTLGLGAIYIELNDRGILIDKGYGDKQASRQVDAFIAEQIGFIVPITALRQWVVGVPLVDAPVVWFDDGFEQLGWQITYGSFMSTQVGKMPHKLKIAKDKINLKLVVDKWEFE